MSQWPLGTKRLDLRDGGGGVTIYGRRSLRHTRPEAWLHMRELHGRIRRLVRCRQRGRRRMRTRRLLSWLVKRGGSGTL